MKTTYRNRLWIVTALLFVGLSIFTLFNFFSQLKNSADARKQSFITLAKAQQFLSSLKDAEAGQRGFLLTNDEHFLKPYEDTLKSLSDQMRDLHLLVSNPAAHQHLNSIEHLVNAKFSEMSTLIDLTRQQQHAAAIALLSSSEGTYLMDSIRNEMALFMSIEEVSLKQFDADFQKQIKRLFALICFTSLFIAVFIATFFYFIYRNRQERLKNLIHADTSRLLDEQENMNQKIQQAYLSVQDSEQKLSVTLNSIGDAVIATDTNTCVTLLNPVAENLTGWTQAEAVGRPVSEIFHIVNKNTREMAVIPVIETLEKGIVQGLANHTVLIARDAREFDIADSCAPIRNRDGLVIGAVLVFRNVTVEYAIQQALVESNERVQIILNTVADGIINIQANSGIIESVNPAVTQMFGYSEAQLLGKKFSTIIPELNQDHLSGSLEYYSASDATRASGLEREVTGRRNDGSQFPLEITASEMRLAGKGYFTCVLRNISVRKQVEETLFEEGALQRAVFNSENFSSIATDPKGVIQIFNIGAERMLGYSAAEVVNKITPVDISDPQEVIDRAVSLSHELTSPVTPGFDALVYKASLGIEDIYELTYIRKDGSRFPALVSVTALRDAHEIIIGYLLIGTDNTVRKQVELEQKKMDQRLRDQQFYTRSLIESNIDALITTDSAGIISDVNRQMEALTGCTRDELIGAPFKNYFTEPARAEAGINRVLTENKVTNYELTARTRDGKETIVSYNATTFFDRDRNLQGVFAAARDITERKHLDLILENNNIALINAKSVAEKANLAKSDFLSSMSHELRTPLSAILGFAQLIESGTPCPTETQKRSLDQILQAGWYLLELINEILDLALIESGKLSLSMEPVDLFDVMLECEALVETQASKRGITVTFPVLDKSYCIKADRIRVKQVLINLLSNAIKYNKENGTVSVTCQAVTPNTLRVSVQDSGEGLSPEKIAQLFQPFNRLGQEVNAEEGTGIGLVMTKRLVELMGGKISVESSEGNGSTFAIDMNITSTNLLPDEESNKNVLQRTARSLSTSSPVYTLLYVEDNPANLMLIEDLILRRTDINLLTARDGLSGIAIARAAQPNLILMDINLPGISGIDALKILATDRTTAHIPVVALSANAIPRDIEKGLEAGFYRYLTKPIKVNEFMHTLDEALTFSISQKTTFHKSKELEKNS